MERHGQARALSMKYPPTPISAEMLRYLSARASASYPTVAESAVALTQGHRDDLGAESAFIVRRHRLWPTASTGRARACTPKCPIKASGK
jgi:hypothetical protein